MRTELYSAPPPLRRENKGFCTILPIRVFTCFGFSKRLTENCAMENSLLREAALLDVAATLKKKGSSQEPGGTCVCERNQPRGAACRYRTDPLTAAFAGLHFCAHRAGWRNRSGRTTGRTFARRSGLVSGDVYERKSAASVYARKGRESNQQKLHFERDGVRAQAADQVLIRTARRVDAESTSVPGRQFALLDTVVGGCRLESSD